MVNRRLRDSLDAATRRAKEARDAAGEVIQDTTKKGWRRNNFFR